MHAPTAHWAAVQIQRLFRGYAARRRAARGRELRIWLMERRAREVMEGISIVSVCVLVLGMLYLNLIYGVKFSDSQLSGWLTSSAIALLVDAFLQQPLAILFRVLVGRVLGKSLVTVLDQL
eukprot:PLAT3815.2.p1 GENE.PLAT3815.2~~PLAT3815.2.p1  ORF type:complete len:121 (+),score=49.98 PLAT3815.2:272-634(+)